MTAVAWGEGAPDGDPEAHGGADALLRRLELDNDDLRAENIRLKGSIGERQDEIVELGERVGRLHAELAEARRASHGAPREIALRMLGRWRRVIGDWARRRG